MEQTRAKPDWWCNSPAANLSDDPISSSTPASAIERVRFEDEVGESTDR